MQLTPKSNTHDNGQRQKQRKGKPLFSMSDDCAFAWWRVAESIIENQKNRKKTGSAITGAAKEIEQPRRVARAKHFF